ncbi:hypothetical protein [Streptomyces purpureus]|nr:hypothetical protein [Streptomyces purpureus]
MSSAPTPVPETRPRVRRGRCSVRRTGLVALLVLAALLGVSAQAVAAGTAVPRPAASAAPDPGGESADTETESTAPARARRAHGAATGAARPSRTRTGPPRTDDLRPVLPRTLHTARYVVMRC